MNPLASLAGLGKWWTLGGVTRPVEDIASVRPAPRRFPGALLVESKKGPVYTVPAAQVAAFCIETGYRNPYAIKK